MLLILFYDIKTYITKKAAIAALFAAILAGLLYSRLPFTKAVQQGAEFVKAGVVDEDRSAYSEMILEFFKNNAAFNQYAHIVTAEQEAVLADQMERNELDVYIIFPKDFVQSVIYIENKPVRVVINSTDTTKMALIQNLLSAYEKYIESVQINCETLYEVMRQDGFSETILQLANIEISMDLFTTVTNKNDFFIEEEMQNAIEMPYMQYYGYELIYLFICYLSLAFGIRAIVEGRAGIYARYRAGGGRLFWYFAGKQLFLLLVSAVLFFLFHIAAFGRMQQAAVDSFVFCVLAGVFAQAVFTAFSAAFKTVKNYLLVSNMLIILLVILGGGVIPLMFLPESFIRAAKFMPNYCFVLQMFQLRNGSWFFSMKTAAAVLLPASFFLLYFTSRLYTKREEVFADA